MISLGIYRAVTARSARPSGLMNDKSYQHSTVPAHSSTALVISTARYWYAVAQMLPVTRTKKAERIEMSVRHILRGQRSHLKEKTIIPVKVCGEKVTQIGIK